MLGPGQRSNLVGTETFTTAHFEYEVAVWGQGKSTTDIMAFLQDGVIAIEAKAREPFDNEVHVWIDKERGNNPRSPEHSRSVIRRYADAFGVSFEELLPIGYQLLHRSLAAVLTESRYSFRQAWMIVQSFAPMTCPEHVRNRSDFDRYMSLVGPLPVLNHMPVRLAWLDQAP